MRAALLLLPGIALLFSGAAAAADDGDDPPHVTVRGTASAPLAPDVAVLRLLVDAEDADAAAALKADAAALTAVTQAAEGQGIAAADIEPGSTTLDHVPSQATPAAGAGAGTPRAFRAATALRVRLHGLARDPSMVAAVLAALAARGATRVEGVDYSLADPAALLAKLTGQAVADARHRAETAAGAANVKLGAMLSIEPPDEAAGGDHLDRVPGDSGRGTVSTTVVVTYAIDP